MRAAVVRRAGPPSVLEIEDVPVPVCGRHEVLVRVEACGVSSRDIVERNGTYRRDVVYPLVMGLEISGVVVEVGSGIGGAVGDPQVGDHVCTKAFSSCGRCRLCRTGRETTCAARRPVRGGYGEYTALDADAVVRVPEHVPFEQSCTLGPAAGVALNAVRDTARVTAGDTVLVTGASGGVGSPSVQLARLCGARVVATTRDPDKVDTLAADGAHEVLVTDGDDAATVRRIRELTGGGGVDVVIDTVGSRVFDLCFDSLAVHGRYAFVGQLFGEDISLNPARIFFKRAQLLGVGSVSRAQLEDVVDLTATGRLTPRVARVLPLESIRLAHELVESARLSGRVVLTPSDTPTEART